MSADDEWKCEFCPVLEGEPNRDGRLCLRDLDRPLSLRHGTCERSLRNEEDLTGAFDAWLADFFSQFPVAERRDLDPLPFIRAFDGTKPRRICPSSWPMSASIRLIVEQVWADTAGMQPRYWDNDLPWIQQPALYTDCYQVVVRARSIAQDWLKEQRERRSGGSGSAKNRGGPTRR